MSHEPQYRIVFKSAGPGYRMTWPALILHLREMREDYGSLELMQSVLRLPDPVERVR